MADSRSTVVQRFDALDTLRCIAVLVMVQGHAFYVTLTAAERAAPWHSWHDYIHGYTAPGFLFGAGLAFGYTTLANRIGEHARWTPTFRKRLYRYLSLFAIGYALQLPPLSASTSSWEHGSLRVFIRVEALQHIGAALLFCQLLVVILRRRIAVAATTFLLGALIVLAGPAVSRMPVAELGPPLFGAYWTSDLGSTFPLIPWAGFVFIGVTTGAVLRGASGRLPLWGIALAFGTAGLLLVGLSLQLDLRWPAVFGEHPYWKVSPYFFLRRLGWVVCTLGVLAAGDALLRLLRVEPGPIRGWVRRISQHSLVLYVAHLVILYGSPLSTGLNRALHGRLDWLQSAGVVALMFAALGLLLVGWDRLEAQHGNRFLHARRSGVALAALASLIAVVRAGDRILASAAPQVAQQSAGVIAPPLRLPVVAPVVGQRVGELFQEASPTGAVGPAAGGLTEINP